MHASGCEWIVDAHGCDPARLADPDVLRELVARLVALLDLHPVAPAQWHCFPASPHAAGGITGLTLLAESHIAVHTFPEHGSLCLNIFCCRPRPDWDAAELAAFVAGEGFAANVRRIERQFASTADCGLRAAGQERPEVVESAVHSPQPAVVAGPQPAVRSRR